MEVKLAKTAGFCMGVRRAVDAVLDVAQHETGRRIYTYGPLIHNPQTIELLQSRGITAIGNIDDIQDKADSVLIIRAHGIAPDERKKIKDSGIKILDATCPKVGYVQAIIKKHASLDYTVVIVGDRAHPEVDGLLGYTRGQGVIVSTLDEAQKIPCRDKVCVVAQTTQDIESYERIVGKIKEICPQAVIFNTICTSTEKRQAEVIALACEMDAMFVVGGKNSANTCRLSDLAQKQNTPTFHIETAEELKNVDLTPFRKIGVSAGASTPNWIIDRVMDALAERPDGHLKKMGFLFRLWIWAVKTDFYSALGAGCLTVAGMVLQKIPVNPSSIAIASLFVYAMHVINRLISRKPAALIGSFRETTYLKHPYRYRAAAIGSLAAALALALSNGLISFLFLGFISLAGVLYNMRIMPRRWRFQSLKDIPGSKNIFMAAAWGLVAAVLPALQSHHAFNAALGLAFVFVFGLVFVRSALSDILEIQSDKLIGRETIPVVFGKENTQKMLRVILLILLAILLASYPMGLTGPVSLYLIASLLYLWICFRLCDRRAGLSGALMEGLLETSYIIAGFGVFCWFILGRG
ncbi:MAG: 4-hydroxy-3-methylbut-2-enyl diphosphate reductase [Smithellaceae bacterium]